jgi:putative alpha-1,2-mannosidase
MGKDEFNRRLEEGFVDFQKVEIQLRIHQRKQPFCHGRAAHQPRQPTQYAGGLPLQLLRQALADQKWAREIMEVFYGSGPMDGWPGDEDQGQMGGWYVMSAMGLFEMRGGCDVEPTYEIGSPLFDKATIHLDPAYYPGGTFTIEAVNNSKENKYVQSATLDGKTAHQTLVLPQGFGGWRQTGPGDGPETERKLGQQTGRRAALLCRQKIKHKQQ